jgi:hypothetical protein
LTTSKYGEMSNRLLAGERPPDPINHPPDNARVGLVVA